MTFNNFYLHPLDCKNPGDYIKDKEMHRQAAQKTLGEHDVTIVSSFDEAMEAMHRDVRRYDKPDEARESAFEVVLSGAKMRRYFFRANSLSTKQKHSASD